MRRMLWTAEDENAHGGLVGGALRSISTAAPGNAVASAIITAAIAPIVDLLDRRG